MPLRLLSRARCGAAQVIPTTKSAYTDLDTLRAVTKG